jgi:hypothetical protein
MEIFIYQIQVTTGFVLFVNVTTNCIKTIVGNVNKIGNVYFADNIANVR